MNIEEIARTYNIPLVTVARMKQDGILAEYGTVKGSDVRQPLDGVDTVVRMPARFVRAKQLGDFLGVSDSYIHKLHSTKNDPPPRTRFLTYDTYSPEFQAWLDRQLRWEGAGATCAPLPRNTLRRDNE